MSAPNRDITFVLTSCGRFDLLRRTLASFLEHNDTKIEKHIIVEDSGDDSVRDVLAEFRDVAFDLIVNQPKRGQLWSIDLAYERVRTPYIFHCEDDWLFTKSGFMEPSLTLLEDFPDVSQVLIRDLVDEKHGVRGELQTHKGISFYAPMPTDYPNAYCYSFNPGLRRLSDYKKIGKFCVILEEKNISDLVRQMGYRQVRLENGGVQHIGRRRHMPDVFVSRLGALERLKRSILKKSIFFKPEERVYESKRVPVSCFIVACNEADRIDRALISVHGLVDEIIVVDSGSTDDTVKIAESYGAKVIFNKWEGDGPQKRFAEEQCRNDWLLNIDADEYLNVHLLYEIRDLFENGPPQKSVYCLMRGDIYFGDSALRRHMNLEHMPRLYDRRKLRFTPQALHTSVPRPKGQTGTLKGVLLHAHARQIRDMIAKETNYAHIGMKKKSLPVLLVRLVTDFPQCFLKHYFLRNHIFGGQKGFIYSMIRAYVRFLRTIAELDERLGWQEKEKTRPTPPPRSPQDLTDKPLAVSSYVVCYNEADRIGRALASLQGLTEELIVVDSGSTDGTQEIARSYGARVIEQPWLGHGLQKRFAEEQCRHDWLINLDSDEWMDLKLQQSIRALFSKGAPPDKAYALKRHDVYHGQLNLWLLPKSHPFVRVYDKTKVRFSEDTVIDVVEIEPYSTNRLRGTLYHRAVRSFWHLARKENNYSSLDAARTNKTLGTLSWRLFMEMPIFFFKFYILRRYFLGGLKGFCYAMVYSFARFQRVAKMLEHHPSWRR